MLNVRNVNNQYIGIRFIYVKMIHSIVGLMNSGKTLYMTLLGFNAFLRGKSVISNYNLTFPHFKINQDFLLNMTTKEDTVINNVCYILDELWLWLMDSRASMGNQQRIASYFFLQSSKTDSEIYITAQDNSQNDIRLRQNLHKLSNCSRVVKIGEKFYTISDEKRFLKPEIQDKLYIKVNTFQRTNIGLETEFIPTKRHYIKAKPIFKLYDTTQKIMRVKK